MPKLNRKTAPIVLLEPNINPITKRFGLPVVANYVWPGRLTTATPASSTCGSPAKTADSWKPSGRTPTPWSASR
jgi:hypothetical protein